MNLNEIIFLGTGSSTGIPTIGCQCKVCTSLDPKDKRYRSSIFLKTKHSNNIIIDTTPDLRSQILREQITKCDSAIITHEHADHTHGIDDMKPFTFERDVYLEVFTYEKCGEFLKDKFPYIFDTRNYFKDAKPLGSGVPKLKLNIVDNYLDYKDDKFSFYLLPHGHTKSLSFYHDGLAYIIDCQSIDDVWIKQITAKKVQVLVIDCVRRKPHQTHLNLEKALYYAKLIGAEKTYLTHIAHELSHQELLNELKDLDFWVQPAFDGLKINYGL